MTSGPFLQLLLYLGIWGMIVFGPFLFAVWYWSERRLSTKHWIVLTALVLVGGLFARVVVISVLATLVLVAITIAWFWHRAILADLDYLRTFGKTHLFPDEETEVTWTIKNEKPLPISWLRWQEAIAVRPFATAFDEGIRLNGVEIKPILEGDEDGIDEVTSLSGFETLSKTCTLRGMKRGYYTFGPTKWEASDLLGLFTASMTNDTTSAITVYPRMFALEELGLPMDAVVGDVRRRSLIEDPSWYRGSREYRPEDAMKTIDWKTTARTNQLQVKSFESTVHPKLMIVANLHAFERISEGMITENMEEVISTAASIARWGLESGFEVGLHSNGALPGAHLPLRIPASAEESQLLAILDYLARLMLIVDRPIEQVIEADLDRLPHGTALLLCTSVMPQHLINVLCDVGRNRRVILVMVGNEAPVHIPGVTVTHAVRRQLAA